MSFVILHRLRIELNNMKSMTASWKFCQVNIASAVISVLFFLWLSYSEQTPYPGQAAVASGWKGVLYSDFFYALLSCRVTVTE
jgi:hypothetical protein